MKLSKMFKIGAAALMVTSLCFVGCKSEEDDDENSMLSGSNNNYSISYKNEGTSVSRGYKTTTFKHLGSLCQMTMSKDSANAGAMGYIWDLESNSARAEKDPRRFFIIGFNYNGSVVKPYVSMYKNVTDIQLQNFGATGQKETGANTTANGATEKEYIALGSKSLTQAPDADGNIVLTVDVKEGADASGNYDGTYIVNIYNGKYEKNALPSVADAYTIIPAADVGYLEAGTSKGSRQKNGAVYANVYAGKTLTGSWKYLDTYSSDEVVEE